MTGKTEDKNKTEGKPDENIASDIAKKCGIIMPIASMDGYPESHWKDVRRILASAIEDAGFEAKIVSESDDIGVIHKRIVQNLYDNPMIVCDISGRNANVMFELGLRLAFDKPTIIVKDDATPYSFDTSVIEHLAYPKDLRYQRIEDFKAELKQRIQKTYATYLKDTSTYSTFLKNFGSFTVPKIDEKIVSVDKYIVQELKSIKEDISQIKTRGVASTEYGSTDIMRKKYKGDLYIRKAHFQFYDLQEADNAEETLNLLVYSVLRKGTEVEVVFPTPKPFDDVIKMVENLGINIGFKKVANSVAYFDDVPF